MSTIDDINTQKDKALAILDQKILDAGKLQNAGNAGMDTVIDTLEDQRQDVLDQALDAALSAQEIAAALAAITQAASTMADVAKHMVTATDYISQVANLGSAVNSVVAALKKPA